jgi:hypothetical protein
MLIGDRLYLDDASRFDQQDHLNQFVDVVQSEVYCHFFNRGQYCES